MNVSRKMQINDIVKTFNIARSKASRGKLDAGRTKRSLEQSRES
jgi:hypothetical protein